MNSMNSNEHKELEQKVLIIETLKELKPKAVGELFKGC